MPSIAILASMFSSSQKIIDEVRSLSGYEVVTDRDIIEKAAAQAPAGLEMLKLERGLYGKPSIFNEFTLEKERCLAVLKGAIASLLKENNRYIFLGLATHLISSEVTHVLKVLIADTKANRIARAVAAGMTEKEAKKEIKKSDIAAFSLTDFLYKKEAWDAGLYDLVIPGNMADHEAVKLILATRQQSTVQKNSSSLQAAADMELAAQVELALLNKGHNVEVYAQGGNIILTVNKGLLNFGKLADELSAIAGQEPGVQGVEVVKGKDFKTSIYRKQEFELPSKVLLVDDEIELAQTISERLINRDLGTYAVHDGQHALDLIATEDDRPDVMVLDLKMPGVDGIEVLRKTKELKPNIEVIILTGHGTEQDRQTCMELGAFAYLQKPTDIEELSESIYRAHKKAAGK